MESKVSDLRTRAIVGVIAAAVALGALAGGGLLLWAFVTAVAVIALAEWNGLAGCGWVRSAIGLVALAVIMLLASPLLWGPGRDTVALLSIAAILVGMIAGTTQGGWGLLYAGLPAISLLFLRGEANGFLLALWTILVVILTDTGAYFAGRAIGGPKLSPKLSPKKTWSGLAGGALAALIGGAIVGRIGGLSGATLWLGAPLALVAQAGDLYESALKRRAGVKDSGRLLPGHGGILDRIDGLVPVATLVAALVAGGAL